MQWPPRGGKKRDGGGGGGEITFLFYRNLSLYNYFHLNELLAMEAPSLYKDHFCTIFRVIWKKEWIQGNYNFVPIDTLLRRVAFPEQSNPCW